MPDYKIRWDAELKPDNDFEFKAQRSVVFTRYKSFYADMLPDDVLLPRN